MNNLNIITCQIKYMLDNGKKKICIYPFGIQGEDAKRILNIRFGIQEHAIVDRELCNYNKNVNNIDFFKSDFFSNGGVLLLASDNNDDEVYADIRNEAYDNMSADSVYDIFSPSLFHKPYMLMDKTFYYAKMPRIVVFESLMREIYRFKVEGCVAECGVNRGWSAMHINRLFPERKIYLFDTFNGFDKRDVEADIGMGLLTRVGDYSDANEEFVLKKMIHRKNVVIRKGWFPETAAGIDEKFCFVSIDTDLYAPVYSGLEFFYSRLSVGGYICVHDGRNGQYPGAIKAVREFCSRMGIGYAIMPDDVGTCVISK